MKGTIVRCAQEMVMFHHPPGTWAAICSAAGCDPETLRVAPQRTFGDELAMRILKTAQEVLELDPSAFFEAYGAHWAQHYAARLYPEVYEEAPDLVSFLGSVNDIHHRITSDADSRPPFFELVWRSSRELTVSYRSDRGLIGLVRGLILGYAAHYGEEVEVQQVSETRLDVHFVSAPISATQAVERCDAVGGGQL